MAYPLVVKLTYRSTRQGHDTQALILSKTSLVRTYYLSFMSQSIPSITIPPSGNPRENFQNLSDPSHPGKFLSDVRPLGFPGTLYFDKFYTFSPFSRSQPYEYLQIWRKNVYLLIKDTQNCKSLNLICISCFRSNALPLSNPYPLGINFGLMPGGWQCLELTDKLHESSPGLKP